VLGHSAEAQRSRRDTQRRHDQARREWEQSGKSSISEETYRTQVQPKLKDVTLSAIMKTLEVSVVYGSLIRRRRVPHRRHWEVLANLVSTGKSKSILTQAVD